MSSPSHALLLQQQAERRALVTGLLRGLSARPKRISSTWLYDARGSQLFDLICEQPEYYLTRAETSILESHAEDIARAIGKRALLVEFGSGASHKTRILLDRLPDLSAYVPVDISRSHLLEATQRIRNAYHGLEVLPVCADFTLPFELPRPRHPASRTVVFFPGSTLGNFDAGPATRLLERMRTLAGRAGGAIIGVDLVKDIPSLIRAYDDAAGVTAQFNLNILARLNREFGADFECDGFVHDAVWNAAHQRIEMHLVSRRPQTVHLCGTDVHFDAGERVVTEHCHKYTADSFARLAEQAGWQLRERWIDDRNQFSIHRLERI